MNPKHTWIWAVIAAGLFAFIFFFERNLQQPPSGPEPLLPGFKAEAVTKVVVQHTGQPEIRAERTNGTWFIVKSNSLPAQASAVEAVLANLQTLAPRRIPAKELALRSRSEEEFGVDNPRTTVVLLEGQHRTQVNIGATTAPGDQVFVRVVGQQDICVVDAGLLRQLPETTGDWRDRALVDLRSLIFDELVVSNSSGTIRLQREATNGTWRLREPLKTGADSARIEEALQKLQMVRITSFISDDARTDLENFGLQPPAFELAFRSGTNLSTLLRFGKALTNAPGQIFARKDDSVVSVPGELLATWNLHFSNFRDRHLFAIPADYNEIEFRRTDTNVFTLQRASSNAWRIVGEKFPVDANLVNSFLTTLGGMEIPLPDGFVKDKATAVEFARYGLTSAVSQIVFKLPTSPGTTNPPTKQVSFGVVATGTNVNFYAQRGDEDSVFAVQPADFYQLPMASWQLRDQRVWNFAPTDVMRITARQDGKAREIIRGVTNSWALAAGSEGVVETEMLEEVVRRFGELKVTAWSARGEGTRSPRFGFKTNHLSLTFELKSGAKQELQFGGVSPAGYPYALVTLEGEPWAFEFSTAFYQFMSAYLKIFVDRP